MLPNRATIVEVGPRDGLQNEPETVSTTAKVSFISKLVEAGLKNIEVTSFVHPSSVPQLADAGDVIRALPPVQGVLYSALVPNDKGFERAVESGIRRIAVFTAASETFTRKNIRMSIAESLTAFRRVVQNALQQGISTRGYLSTAFVCPYEGAVPQEIVRQLTEDLLGIGVDEVAISDTIGAASPRDVLETVGFVVQKVPASKIALHFHDTYGTALANVYAGLELGIQTFDSSAGGFGGCPFAPGAAGNLATEDLVYMLDRMGIQTGVSLPKVVEAADVIAKALKRDPPSRQWRRLKGSCAGL